MFDDEKIKLIESMPDHDALLIIWIKLLAQAGKSNASGYLFLTQNIPYTEEMLATIFNRPLNTVRMALETFRKFGMIDITDDCIHICNWEKHQNVCGMEAIREQTRKRVQKHREKQKQIKECNMSNITERYNVTQSNAIELDKEKDIDKDIKNIRSFENDPKNLNQNEPDIFEPENEICNAEIIETDKEIISDDKPELIDINNKPDQHDSNRKEQYDPKFELFWAAYPRKVGKREAFVKWKNRVKEKIDPVEIAAAARNYAVDCIKRKTEAEYIKHPKTFLGKNRPFEDYLNLKGGVSVETERKGVIHNGEYVDFDAMVFG
jgi:predicted phage replisome organizer